MRKRMIVGLDCVLLKFCLSVVLCYVSCVCTFSSTPVVKTDRGVVLKVLPEVEISTSQNGLASMNNQEVKKLFEDILGELTMRGLQLQEAAETINALSAVNERVRTENAELTRTNELLKSRTLKFLGMGFVGGVVFACLIGGPILYGISK